MMGSDIRRFWHPCTVAACVRAPSSGCGVLPAHSPARCVTQASAPANLYDQARPGVMRGATHTGVERGGGPRRARLARRRRSGRATGRHRLQQRQCGGCATTAGALRAWPPRNHPQRCGWTGAFAGRAFRGRTVEVAQRAERGAWRRDLVRRPTVWPAQARQSYPGPQELDHHGGLSAAARCWPAAAHDQAGSPQWPDVFARRACCKCRKPLRTALASSRSPHWIGAMVHCTIDAALQGCRTAWPMPSGWTGKDGSGAAPTQARASSFRRDTCWGWYRPRAPRHCSFDQDQRRLFISGGSTLWMRELR